MGFDVYPLWLQSAITQARLSETAAEELDSVWDGHGDDSTARAVEREMVAAMGCIVACAAAIDAFYGSIRDRCHNKGAQVAHSQRKGRARERIILATFQQRFALPNEVLPGIMQPLKDVFAFRHMALHAHGRPEEPVLHPRLHVGMSRKHVIFRAENATVATSFALTVLAWLTTRPHQRYPELRRHCGYAREWLQPLVNDWETDHSPTGLPNPLTEWSKPKKSKLTPLATSPPNP